MQSNWKAFWFRLYRLYAFKLALRLASDETLDVIWFLGYEHG
jgi:hypothetical protein